ncbi:MAG: VOC family protein [Lachnospiraceae bacterium]|nr:VOC family protein [Lachnospiraceae bacterium]
MRIHHIGYLVRKMEKALRAFKDLGYELTGEIIHDEYRQADICFLEKDGYMIELVSPVSKTSVVSDLMKKIGNSPYHICYETEDMDREIEKLNEQHYVMCAQKHEAVAIGGRNVCFMIHPYLGMIELLETK